MSTKQMKCRLSWYLSHQFTLPLVMKKRKKYKNKKVHRHLVPPRSHTNNVRYALYRVLNNSCNSQKNFRKIVENCFDILASKMVKRKQIWLFPPSDATTHEVGLSVIKLPQLMFEPFANLFGEERSSLRKLSIFSLSFTTSFWSCAFHRKFHVILFQSYWFL